MERELFKTEDMALATTLKVRGIDALRLEHVGADGCCWVYAQSPALSAVVGEYACGTAKVEPKEFAKKMALIRRALYRFMDQH